MQWRRCSVSTHMYALCTAYRNTTVIVAEWHSGSKNEMKFNIYLYDARCMNNEVASKLKSSIVFVFALYETGARENESTTSQPIRGPLYVHCAHCTIYIDTIYK